MQLNMHLKIKREYPVETHKDQWYLWINNKRDDGKGLRNNFDIDNEKSLGFILINALVKQLEGEIEVLIDNGSVFKIKFKELEYNKRL